jgi:hypothetical protein
MNMPSKTPSTKSSSTRAKSAKTKETKQPTREEIERRAYEISQSKRDAGPVTNWLEAERELVEAAAPKPRRRKTATSKT